MFILQLQSRVLYALCKLVNYLIDMVYTGTYHEKGQYFLSLISESETQILYRFITHRVKYVKPLFLDILMIMAYRY